MAIRHGRAGKGGLPGEDARPGLRRQQQELVLGDRGHIDVQDGVLTVDGETPRRGCTHHCCGFENTATKKSELSVNGRRSQVDINRSTTRPLASASAKKSENS